jgi:predicted peptidase
MYQTPQQFEGQGTRQVALRYLLYLPPGYNPARKWPAILFLHGSGERGDDLDRVKLYGIPHLIEEGHSFPFIIASPQCPAGTKWIFEIDALNGLLDSIIANYPVDENRLYLTGLSMGGTGTWLLGATRPERFAALAPICGSSFPERACALKDKPVWAFHGDADPVVSIQESQTMVDALEACGAKHVRLTIYPNVGHNAWTPAYDTPELYDWFLSHTRRA